MKVIVIRLLRVAIAGAIARVAIEFVQIPEWWVVGVAALMNAIWKGLRNKYPDYWLWRLM